MPRSADCTRSKRVDSSANKKSDDAHAGQREKRKTECCIPCIGRASERVRRRVRVRREEEEKERKGLSSPLTRLAH